MDRRQFYIENEERRYRNVDRDPCQPVTVVSLREPDARGGSISLVRGQPRSYAARYGRWLSGVTRGRGPLPTRNAS
jgi:hypothetical protein